MKKNLEKSKLKRLYRGGYSLRELARLYDCTHQKLSELFKEWEIPLRSKSETLKLVHQRHPEYGKKIAESLKGREASWMKRPEVRAEISESTKKRWREQRMSLISKQKLKKLYWDQEKTLREIAKELKISTRRLTNLMDDYGIERRSPAEVMKLLIKHGEAGWQKHSFEKQRNAILKLSKSFKEKGFRSLPIGIKKKSYRPDIITFKNEEVIAVEVYASETKPLSDKYRNKKTESAKNYNYDKIWFYNYLLDKWNKFTLGDGNDKET